MNLLRLRPEDLNSSVLNYMTESLGYGLSDLIHTVINNKPSAVLATYQLLLKKLIRHQKGAKTIKVIHANAQNQTYSNTSKYGGNMIHYDSSREWKPASGTKISPCGTRGTTHQQGVSNR